jgi:copper chaperone CopZ
MGFMASQDITLNVDGMSCGHCSGMVQRTLEEIDGISNVSVDLDEKKATFTANDSQLIDKAIKEVTDAGYKASK